MLNAKKRKYDYYLYEANNAYGQVQLSAEKKGKISISIVELSQNLADSIKYKNASFLGLTTQNITDKFVIQYGDIKLKVLYVNKAGRYNQAFLGEM